MDKKTILKRIQKEFEAVEVPCEWIGAGEESPVDLLLTSHSAIGLYGQSAGGEFFFLETEEGAEGTEYFMSMMTLEDDLQTSLAAELLEGMTRLNFYLPCGAFTVGTDGEIIFKLSIPITASVSDEAAGAQAEAAAAHTLDFFHRYIGLITDLAEGKVTPSEVVDLFEG